MNFIKFQIIEGYAILINPAFIESIEGMEENTKINLASGKSFEVGMSPSDIKDTIEKEISPI
jgi:uncharacterized protein YlzI (FlbEa/FlbD family)